MTTRRPALKTNDKDIESYTKAIETCLEVMAEAKKHPRKRLRNMAEILAGTMIGIARQVIRNKNLKVTLEDVE